MNWLKTIVGVATVGMATAVIITKLIDDNKKQKELDEFFCPDEDTPIVVSPTDLPYEQVERDVNELAKVGSNHVTCYFTFVCENEEKAVEFQEDCSDFGLSTSMEKNRIDVMYSGETQPDELNEFFMKLYPVLNEKKPEYQGAHFEG